MARKNNAAWQIGLAVGGVALVVFVAVVGLVVVYSTGSATTKGGQSVISAAKKMSREEFRQKYGDATKETILKDLGRPRNTDDIGNHSAWSYGSLTYDPISGKDDTSTTIWIGQDGRVSLISFN